MLVIQTAGAKAGELVDMPMPLARRLLDLGRVKDARHKTQLADPTALSIDNRLADSQPEPAETAPLATAPQARTKRAGRH